MKKYNAALAAVALLGTGHLALADTFIIMGSGPNLAAAVKAAGGKLEASYPFGVSIASSDDANFSLKGFAVVRDVGFDVARPAIEVQTDAGFPPNSGDDDFFFDLQWGHNYVGAQ